MASVGLVTIAEYARARGVSHEAVRKAAKAGRITLIDGRIDPAVADIQWERNTRKAVGRGGRSVTGERVAGDGAAQTSDAAPDRASSLGASGRPEYDYEASRAKREHHEAVLAELKERERLNQLVDIAQVRLAVADIARVLTDGLERIPDRVSVQIHAGMAQAEIHAQLERELAAVRQDLQAVVTALPARLHATEAP